MLSDFMSERKRFLLFLACLLGCVSVSAAAEGNDVVVRDTVPDSTAVSSRSPFRIAIKTNLAYDALLVPNIGVEFYLGKNWSVEARGMYAWWERDPKHRYWNVCGVEATVRKYLGSSPEGKPRSGHHLGAYLQALTYDVEFGGRGYMGARPGAKPWKNPSYGVGLEYGYSLPVCKNLNIDFSVGIGYLRGKYHVYDPIDNHYVWKETRMRNWFGPTRAEVSLVWMPWKCCSRAEKGGRR